MSYQIYYDRAFIRIGEKFIPIVNSGSNNCWETVYKGREVPEKCWNVLNWKRDGQFLFSEAEIKEIARYYDEYNQESGVMFKSRNRVFEQGEFERWVINGMKSAYTVEEYISFGNSFFVLDYSPQEIKDWKRHPFKTTDELLKILDDLKEIKSLEIKLEYNREVRRPKVSRTPKKPLKAADLWEYYVLKGEVDGYPAYLIKLNSKGGFRYALLSITGRVKIFKTEKEARAYSWKYRHILDKYNFTIEKVVNSH